MKYEVVNIFIILLQKGVGLVAINDSFLIEGTIYRILKIYFKSEPYYMSIVELFHEVRK